MQWSRFLVWYSSLFGLNVSQGTYTWDLFRSNPLTIKCSISSAYNGIRNFLFWNSFCEAFFSLTLYKISALTILVEKQENFCFVDFIFKVLVKIKLILMASPIAFSRIKPMSCVHLWMTFNKFVILGKCKFNVVLFISIF